MWWVGLQCVIVVFLDHTHLPSTYFLHTHPYFNQDSAKEWGRGYPWELGGGGLLCNSQSIEYKSCGILTRTVWSVVVGHVVLAIHIVHSLENSRAGPISSQILVLSENNLFILKGKLTIYIYCAYYAAWIMPTLRPFLTSWYHAGLACSL